MRAAVMEAIEAQTHADKVETTCDDDDDDEKKLILEIIRDFLEYAHLDRTISIFEPESNCSKTKRTRKDLSMSLGLKDKDDDEYSEKPVLLQLLQQNQRATAHDNNIISSSPQNEMDDYGSDAFEDEIASEVSLLSEEDEESSCLIQDHDAFFDQYDYIEPAELPLKN